MVRKLVSATVSAALCVMSVAPAMAQEYRFTGFDAPRGASATVNLRIPLTRQNRQRTTYGFNVAYGRRMPLATMDGQTTTRAATLADIRLTGDGDVRRAQLLAFDLRNLDQNNRRLNLTGEDGTLWIVVGLVAAGVAICLIADCFEGDDDSDSSSN